MKCSSCAGNAEPGRKLCDQHLEYQRTYHRLRREKAKSAGLCHTCCLRSPVKGRAICKVCAERTRRCVGIKRASRKCPQCRRRRSKSATRYGQRCWQCRCKNNPGLRTRVREAKIKRRARLLAAGICVTCGRRPADRPSGRCDHCSFREVCRTTENGERNAAAGLCRCGRKKQDHYLCPGCYAAAARKDMARYERLKAAGICVMCREEFAVTMVYCAECREIAKLKAKAGKERKRAETYARAA